MEVGASEFQANDSSVKVVMGASLSKVPVSLIQLVVYFKGGKTSASTRLTS